MTRLPSRQSLGLVLGLVLGIASGCSSTIPIRKLLDDPARYDGQNVKVRGQITDTVGVLGYGVYRLDDGTGTLPVVTRAGGAPRGGTNVGVEGRFRSGFTLGTQSMAVIVESKREGN